MIDKFKIVNEFDKKNIYWADSMFFTVYIKDNIKRIRIRGLTCRFSTPNSTYFYWGHKKVHFDAPLIELLEWGDIEYGISKYRKENYDFCEYYNFDDEDGNVDEYYSTPEPAFDFANYMIKGRDKKGSRYLDLISVKEDTPCGNYYGCGMI